MDVESDCCCCLALARVFPPIALNTRPRILTHTHTTVSQEYESPSSNDVTLLQMMMSPFMLFSW